MSVYSRCTLIQRCTIETQVSIQVRGARDKTIRIFESFAEADKADWRVRQELTPAQRVVIFFAIRERAVPGASEQEFARVYRILELKRS